jgi:copper(I)-binding protein
MTLFRALAVTMALTLPMQLPASLHAQNTMESEPITLGPLLLTGAFLARDLSGRSGCRSIFLTIENTGAEDDTLIAATSSVAGHMEVHEMAMDGDVVKMREQEEGLPSPAGQKVTLKSGGYHVLLMDLKEPLVEGTTLNVTLTFAKAGTIDVPMMVGARNATSMGGMDHSHMQHNAMGGHDHAAAHGSAAHTAPSSFDQAALMGDAARIDGLLRATFGTAENPLSLGPVLIGGNRHLRRPRARMVRAFAPHCRIGRCRFRSR